LTHLLGGAAPRRPGGLRTPGLGRVYSLLQSSRLLAEYTELPIEQVKGGEWFSASMRLRHAGPVHHHEGEGVAGEDGYGNQECTRAIAIPDAFHNLSGACHLGNKITKWEFVARAFCRRDVAMAKDVLQGDVVLVT
jgi:hypothetical protein